MNNFDPEFWLIVIGYTILPVVMLAIMWYMLVHL